MIAHLPPVSVANKLGAVLVASPKIKYPPDYVACTYRPKHPAIYRCFADARWRTDYNVYVKNGKIVRIDAVDTDTL